MQAEKKVLNILFVIGLLVTACTTAEGPGPRAWIDQPLDQSHFELGPVIIQAHASDEEGVSVFHISVNGSEIDTVSGEGNRLGEFSKEWNPSGPGTYTIAVWAEDQSGNQGNPATATIFIGGEVPTEAQPVDTSPPEEATEPPEETSTFTPAASTATFPPPTWTFAPPTNTPLPATNTPLPPTPDTKGPTITFAGVSLGQILTQGGGCDAQPRTFTVTITANDPAGLGSATTFYNVGGETGDVAMTNMGGGTFQGTIGPVSTAGTMSLFVNITDAFGNPTLSGVMNVTVVNCIG